MRKSKLFFSIFSLFVLCGCSAKPISDVLTPNAESRVLVRNIEVAGDEIQNILQYFKRADTNIKEFKFVKVINGTEVETASEEFYRGLFDQIGLRLKCYYDDGKSKGVDLLYKRLPQKYVEALFEVGIHNFTIHFRGKETKISLTTIYNEEVPTYSVRYLNYHGDVLKTYMYEAGTIFNEEVPEVPDRAEDVRFIYADKHWSEDLIGQYITANVDISPRYNPILKRSHGKLAIPRQTEYATQANNRLLMNRTPVASDERIAWFYMGRSFRVPILGYNQSGANVIEHTEGVEDVITYNFGDYIDTKENIFDAVLDSTFHFDDTKPASFPEGNEKASRENFEATLSDTRSVHQRLDVYGRTDVQFEENGIVYQVFNSYIGDVIDDFVDNHPNPISATIPATSQTGKYRLCVEADLDLILLIHVNAYAAKDNMLLNKVEPLLIVDETSVDIVMDYVKEGSFNSTSLPSYSGEDIYIDALATYF
ncbi:MAG: hypothetical protein IKP50_04780 [Bacilli bacterium]|nr:hypothetical protein [Bacilli bacterium]